MNEAHYIPGMQGCSDGGCIFGYKAPGTMVTNGGCSCQRELQRSVQGLKAVQLINYLRREWPQMSFAGMDDLTPIWVPVATVPTRTMLHKVNMIKDVRQAAGCGLKEAKEAVDNVYELCDTYEQVIETAVAHYRGRHDVGYCVMGDNCHCGGDVPSVREGCFEWKSM